MREYLELEFTAALADKQLTFALDVERVIDDVVLFCMLVGNDFLPGEILFVTESVREMEDGEGVSERGC